MKTDSGVEVKISRWSTAVWFERIGWFLMSALTIGAIDTFIGTYHRPTSTGVTWTAGFAAAIGWLWARWFFGVRNARRSAQRESAVSRGAAVDLAARRSARGHR